MIEDDDEYCEPAPRLPAHAEIVRILSATQDPRLHVESGWMRCERTQRDHLLWLVYLRPRPRLTKILNFPRAR